MSDSLRAKELAERATYIVTTYGRPGCPPFGPDMEWGADGVNIFYDRGENWFLSVRTNNQTTKVYENGQRFSEPFCTTDLATLERTLNILRQHMVLDDLANA